MRLALVLLRKKLPNGNIWTGYVCVVEVVATSAFLCPYAVLIFPIFVFPFFPFHWEIKVVPKKVAIICLKGKL